MEVLQTVTSPREVIFIDVNQTALQKREKQLRVAAYCRVSTESDEQATSYKTQQSHYREMIRENNNWRLVEIYAEEVSGTRADKRIEFMKMIQKCRKKKIDLIITKSVSRFARNTVDCLSYIRELKSLGIGIIFEKENINTLEAKGEVILTMLSSIAQEESNSISANVKMGLMMRAKEGKVVFRKTYGFIVTEDKTVQIIPDEAEIVRLVFQNYLSGNSERKIIKLLESMNIPSPSGNDKWCVSTIQRLISNEKYCGDILTQKTAVQDPITKKVIKNEGQLPRVLIKNHHPPIITRAMYERTQVELARRNSKQGISKNSKTKLSKFSSDYALTEILVCDECNSPYKRTTWARNGEKKIVWRCVNRLESGKRYCHDSPTLNEKDLHQAIVESLNETKNSRQILIDYLIKKIELGYAKKDNTDEEIKNLEAKIAKLKQSAMEIVRAKMQNIAENTDYVERLSEINEQTKTLTITLGELRKNVALKGNLEQKIYMTKETLSQMTETLTEYDDSITRQCVDEIRVIDKNRIRIIFKDGYEFEKRVGDR